MSGGRPSAWLGVATCVVVLVLIAIPYLIGSGGAVRTYYLGGIFGPSLVGVFALVLVVVFLAGATGRSDPAVTAGIVVVVGLFAAVLSFWWAAIVSPALVGGFTSIDAFRYHRWLLALVALLVPVAGGWYARAVL